MELSAISLKFEKYFSKKFLSEKLEEIIEKFKKWDAETSQRNKILILVLICGVPLFVYLKFIYSIGKQKIVKLENDLKIMQMKLSKYKSLAKKKEYLQETIKKRKEFLQQIKIILPLEKEIPELLKMIVEKAKSSGLEIISFSPKKEQARDYYQIIPFVMKVKGGFKELITFLNKVENGKRLVTLENLEIKTTGNNLLESIATFYTFKYTEKKTQTKKKK